MLCGRLYALVTEGFIMKVFPRDPKRRAEWAANVGRKNWSPTNSSVLCEVSFGV